MFQDQRIMKITFFHAEICILQPDRALSILDTLLH